MTTETTRTINFDDAGALYLALNIKGHDVIHDYGKGSTAERWLKNSALVRQFINSGTFSLPTDDSKRKRSISEEEENISKKVKRGGVEGSGSDEESELDLQYITPNRSPIKKLPETQNTDLESQSQSQFQSPFDIKSYQPNRKIETQESSTQTGRDITSEREQFNQNTEQQHPPDEDNKPDFDDDFGNEIDEYTMIIKTGLVFTFFNMFLYLYKDSSYNISYSTPQINLKDINPYLFIYPEFKSNDIGFNNLYNTIAEKFIFYCVNTITEPISYEKYYDTLIEFLDKDYIVSSIFDIVGEEIRCPNEEVSIFDIGRNLKGGAADKNEPLDIDECKELIQNINEYITDNKVTLNEVNTIFEKYKNNPDDPDFKKSETIQNYNNTCKEILNGLKYILRFKKQITSIGNLDSNSPRFFHRIDNPRVSKRVLDTKNLFTDFTNYINSELIEKYEAIIKTQQKELDKIEEQKLRAESGDYLSPEEKTIREQFITFIAKSVLYMENICDNKGKVSLNIDNLNSEERTKNDLIQEINILLYLADWTSINKNDYPWGTVRTEDLDTVLYNHFLKNYAAYEIIGGRYYCPRIKKYIINNAAPLKKMNDKTFCPYTSIIDGMSNCSWNTSGGQREYGNMDFKLANENETIYYNGKLNIVNEEIIIISLNILTSNGLIIDASKNVNVAGSDLEAHRILKNTLSSLITKIVDSEQNIRDEIFTNNAIFENIFNIDSNVSENINNLWFNVVFQEILFKGVGDLFQEINAVAKHGGYTMENYYADPDVLPYPKESGIVPRFFAANDRPSGTRFMFMLINGSKEKINTRAFGGYFASQDNAFLIYHPSNDVQKLCSPPAEQFATQLSGGTTTKNRTKTKKTTRKNGFKLVSREKRTIKHLNKKHKLSRKLYDNTIPKIL